MKTVSTNIWMLVLRLLLLALFVYIYQWPLEKIRTEQYHNNEGVFWLGFFVIMMFPVYIVWTLCGVLWIQISNNKSTIRFHHFYKRIDVHSSAIDGYYKTVHNTKVKTFKGFILKLKSGRVIEITEYNLKSLTEINDFLTYNKIPLRAEIKSWFPLKRRI